MTKNACPSEADWVKIHIKLARIDMYCTLIGMLYRIAKELEKEMKKEMDELENMLSVNTQVSEDERNG
mgnify:CR=1 FL=1